MAGGIKLALDQNIPPFVLDASQLIPEIDLAPIWQIDPRLAELDDRELFIALYQLGWSGLITNNYKMLRVPAEVASIMKTKAVVFAVEGAGHDPLRATGAVLLELPAIVKRIVSGKGQVFRVRPRDPRPIDPWDCFRDAAQRQGTDPDQLYQQVRVSDDELARPLLG